MVTVNFVGGATILVKILMPTNKKGTRLRARLGNCARSKAKIYPWDYALSDAKNYEVAAKAYADWLKWEGSLIGSWVDNNAIFVFAD